MTAALHSQEQQTTPTPELPQHLLTACRERAAGYDRDNRFCYSDFSELCDFGYLRAAVPAELGGWGLTLAQLCATQRQLAQHAPATALAVNMHQVWVAAAALLAHHGDDILAQILTEATAGEIFAFGVSEAGNDWVLLDAKTTATSFSAAAASGYKVTGDKVFTTLTPVWTLLGVHAKTAAGELVFGFLDRAENEGRISNPGTWNPLGMRATQSFATRLDEAVLAADRVVAQLPVGAVAAPLIRAINTCFSLLIAAVYLGIAERAQQLAQAAAAQEFVTMTGERVSKAERPAVSAQLVTLEMHVSRAQILLEQQCALAWEQLPEPAQFTDLGAVKTAAVTAASTATAVALQLQGARGYQADSETARLHRDALAGFFHPTSASPEAWDAAD